MIVRRTVPFRSSMARNGLQTSGEPSPISLSLPLREERYSGAEVSAYFDNLLPDNDQIRRKVAERVGAEGTDALARAVSAMPKGFTGEIIEPIAEATRNRLKKIMQ